MAKVKAWTTFAERLIAVGHAIFQTSVVPVTERGASDLKVLALTLLARTVSNLKGTLVLLREKRIVEARTIARCCYENYYWIGGLVEEGDEFVRHMLHDEMKRKQMRGAALLTCEAELEEEVESKLRTWMRDAKKDFPNARTLHPKDVASRGPTGNSYVFYGQLSSDAAHPSIDALGRYVPSLQEDGVRVRAIDFDPVVAESEIVDTLNLACLAAIGVCVGVNQLVGPTPAGEKLIGLSDEYGDLTKKG